MARVFLAALLSAAFITACCDQQCGAEGSIKADRRQSVTSDHDGELFLLQTEVAVSQRNTKTVVHSKHSSVAEARSRAGPWSFYNFTAMPLLIITLVVAWFTRPQLDSSCDHSTYSDPRFQSHRFRFLLIWGVCVAADWLQGPYVYALYDSFGYGKADINTLFVIGFASSAVFGTFVGSLADTWGRKRSVLLYCVLYIISCSAVHCSLFPVLAMGRIAGGIATSLLFSTFECWMVGEHNGTHQFSGPLLRYMFSMMYFVNYLVAIFSGLVAQTFVSAFPLRRIEGYQSLHVGGNTCAYDIAIVMLCTAIPLICFSWSENYGDQESKQTTLQSYKAAFRALTSSWKVPLVGVIMACFEGGMYAFVINWTPALSMDGAPDPPHGLIFSTMMMCCMMGSATFSFFNPRQNPAIAALIACIISTCCFGVAALEDGKSAFVCAIYVSFLCFEASVGLYFPSIGSLKSEVVPEEARAAIYNCYRIPLNLVVVSIIIADMSVKTTFAICAVLMAVAFGILMVMARSPLSAKLDSSKYECS